MRKPDRGPFKVAARFVAVASVFAISLSLVGCGGQPAANNTASAGTIQEGGTLHLSLTGEPGLLDPTLNETLAASTSYPSWCEALYLDTVETEPSLATGMPEFSADGRSATIGLIKGAKFADGTDFNAEAMKFSLDRHRTMTASARAADLSYIDGVEVVDDYTIKLNFNMQVAPGVVVGALAGRASIAMSPTAIQSLGDDKFGEAPVCVGAFKFDSRIPQDSLTLVRDPGYYAADKVHFDSIVYHVIPDAAVRLTNLRAGQLQIVDRVSPTDLNTVKNDPNLKVESLPGLGYMNFALNLNNANGSDQPPARPDRPLARSLQLRQALALSIDRNAINNVVYEGNYAPAYGFIAPGTVFATDINQAVQPFDPEEAKRLIAASGEPTPIKISITMTQQPEIRRVAEMVQQMANAVGFEVTIDAIESIAAMDKAARGETDIYFNSFTGTADPDTNVTRVIGLNSRVNSGRAGDASSEALLQGARQAQSTEERIELYDQLHTYIVDNVATIFLLRPANFVAHSANLTGLVYRSTGAPVVHYAAFTS